MKKAEGKPASLFANLGDLNRPLRVRPVRYMAREWWAVDAEDIWPGMVMDLRRLGFEAVAMGEEVLVREGAPAYELQMEGPNAQRDLKPFPTVHPTIQIRKEPFSPPGYGDLNYLDDYDEDEEDADDEFEPEDLDKDENE